MRLVGRRAEKAGKREREGAHTHHNNDPSVRATASGFNVAEISWGPAESREQRDKIPRWGEVTAKPLCVCVAVLALAVKTGS